MLDNMLALLYNVYMMNEERKAMKNQKEQKMAAAITRDGRRYLVSCTENTPKEEIKRRAERLYMITAVRVEK